MDCGNFKLEGHVPWCSICIEATVYAWWRLLAGTWRIVKVIGGSAVSCYN